MKITHAFQQSTSVHLQRVANSFHIKVCLELVHPTDMACLFSILFKESKNGNTTKRISHVEQFTLQSTNFFKTNESKTGIYFHKLWMFKNSYSDKNFDHYFLT